MPEFAVQTPLHRYPVLVENGVLQKLREYVPERAAKVFVITTRDVWELHGETVKGALRGHNPEVLFFAGGEDKKRLTAVEELAEQMVSAGGDRTSIVVTFGGGVVCDVAGFVAAVFMRGIPVIQIPTTLLAQVDAGVGGKTGVNLTSGKNLVGAFHQPLAVLIDPGVLATLDEREYRAGLFEVLKHGVIRSPELFKLMAERPAAVLEREAEALEFLIAESVRIKSEVVSSDEKESGLRRILNFGHTFGHALEAETGYTRLLHGEAVGWGMYAATILSELLGRLPVEQSNEIVQALKHYGPIPSLEGVSAENLVARMQSDKKTLRGKVHFILPDAIGYVSVVSGVEERMVLAAVKAALE
jgi:3-dehydroquinate synthase